jgi:membrane protein implicated in regulation of membrane protease activity
MYVVFFGIGIGFVVLSIFADAVLDFDGIGFALLQPKIIAIFMVVTGGVGLALTSQFDQVLMPTIILVISVLSGLVIAGLVHRFVITPLKKAENTSTFKKEDTIGTTAEVISPIPKGGYGKIRYSVSGSTVTGPAKSEDDMEVTTGEKVFIMDIEKGTYMVRRHLDINQLIDKMPKV